MPGLDGFEVLERLQEDPETKMLPVVVLTAKSLSSSERRTLRDRTVSLLEKSAYSPQELRRLVDRALAE
jgi:CheY-like chemotaxis protein